MEKLMELAERFVAAQEKIAEALQTQSCSCDKPTVTIESPETENPYPDNDDRDAWVVMCDYRGIEIPKGTKTTTLVKKVKAWDAAHAGSQIPEPEMVVTKETGVKTIEEPFVEPDADPFAQDTEADPFAAEKQQQLTMDLIRERLQDLQKKSGNGAIIKILTEHGGCDKLKNLTEEKYGAVYAAAEEMING